MSLLTVCPIQSGLVSPETIYVLPTKIVSIDCSYIYICIYTHICTHTEVTIIFKEKEAINLRARDHGRNLTKSKWGGTGCRKGRRETDKTLFQLKTFKK